MRVVWERPFPNRYGEEDWEELKAMGCNAIRCSHNPPSPEFLDLCDELGFLVQDEAFDEWEGVKNKWWQGHNVYPPKHFGYYEDFPEWHKRDLQAMVKRDRNHPSIVFWSIGNEIDYPNDPYCHPSFKEMTGNNDKNKPAAERMYDPNKPNAERLVTISKRLVSLVKECDTTRPVTAALSFPELSNITGLAETLDVVGYNYKEQWYKEGAEKWPDRVIFGSENSKDLEAWLTVKNSDPICAQFVWTGIDYLGEAKGWPVRVASSGFLNTAGYRKPSYYYRQSLWSESPMVQIVTVKSSEKKEYDSERFHWNYEKDKPVCINVYSNCAQVELFLNGKSLGIKFPQKEQGLFASWEIPFQAGELRAVGLVKEGREYTSILKTAGEPNRLGVKKHKTLVEETGYTEMDITLVDKNETWINSTETEVQVKIAGSGTLMGLENGNIQDLTPYSSAKRSTFQGRLKAYVRQDNLKEEIRVTLKAEGMEEVTIKI
jgi:beta-galactosidase